MGAYEFCNRDLVNIEDGFRVCERSWSEELLDLKKQGLTRDPDLAVTDGSFRVSNAVHKVHSQTKHQRCWFHRADYISNNLPNTYSHWPRSTFSIFGWRRQKMRLRNRLIFFTLMKINIRK